MYLPGKLALQGAHRGARGLRGAAADQVGDRLGLGKVELVVEKGALGKFARTRRARAERQHTRQQQVEHHRTAVAVQLQHMFAGEGGRRREIQREAGVDQRAVSGPEIPPSRLARRWQRPQQAARDVRHVRSGNAHDANAALSGRRGDGGDGVGVRRHDIIERRRLNVIFLRRARCAA